MILKIAYVGYGFVGKACHEQFRHNASAIIIDPKYSQVTIKDLHGSEMPEVVFIAINAPTLTDGTVDISVIDQVVDDLLAIDYKGIVVLKSTIPPAAARYISTKIEYVYSPEFLREKTWETDALRPAQIILGGNIKKGIELKSIYQNHSHVWQAVKYMLCDYEEASLLKYAINSYLANKVTFMNQLYELYHDVCGCTDSHFQPEVWQAFTDMLSTDTRFGHSHLAVPGPDGNFGYGGSCFPKDVKAMIGFDTHDRMTVLRETELANTRLRFKAKVDK